MSRTVLWFINKVPLAVAEATGVPSVRGGWLDEYIGIVGAEPDVELTVAFPDWTGRAPRSDIDSVSFVGLPTGDPGSGIAGVLGRWRHDVAPRDVLSAVSRTIRDVAPDLIHVHGTELCFGLAVRDCGVPAVISIQGSPTAIRRLYVRGIDRHYVRSLSFVDFLKGRGPVHDHARTRAQAANEALTLAGVRHVAGRTEWDRRLALVMAPQAVYHHCDEPMRPAFHRTAWNRDSATPGRVFSTSGHYAKKGVSTLLRAVDALSRVVPETTLVLAGMAPGSDNERATMRHARALGIAERVRILGELDAEALAAELSQASVFVNSSHVENSSNALCEAQLVGTPCIASSAGGLVTLADHGSAALLVQDGDPTALAGALLSLLGDPEEAARLGQRGRVLATARHDPDNIRAQIRSLYDAVLA